MISNGQIILNVDCDMYSNNSQSVRDALCFFMDEEKGHEIAFVQFPQNFENITENDIYGNSLRTISEVNSYVFINQILIVVCFFISMIFCFTLLSSFVCKFIYFADEGGISRH